MTTEATREGEGAGMWKKIFTPSIYWLLAFVPAAFLCRYIPAIHNQIAIFIFAGLGIVPLAALMGRATEHLAAQLGEAIGGLLNATFGNAAELIISLFAMSKGLIGVVKASITGSIIGNILLVMGLSIFTGGLKYRKQTFNQTAVQTASTSLMLAAIALFTPTIFHISARQRPVSWTTATEQNLSLAIAIILFICYACVLLFSLKTHKTAFNATEASLEATSAELEEGWPKKKAMVVLLLATIATAFLAEFLVGAVEATRQAFGITETFLGVIVVAVVGNAAEHATAVLAARKNKMDLSISIALGSSLQIALFVAPVLLFCSYAFGTPMNLEFAVPELFAVIASVYIAGRISGDGESNWLEGVQLLAVYLIMAALFFFLPPH
jgi:Ca2+:H+ antiporter